MDSFIYGEQCSGFRDYLEALLTLAVISLLRVDLPSQKIRDPRDMWGFYGVFVERLPYAFQARLKPSSPPAE